MRRPYRLLCAAIFLATVSFLFFPDGWSTPRDSDFVAYANISVSGRNTVRLKVRGNAGPRAKLLTTNLTPGSDEASWIRLDASASESGAGQIAHVAFSIVNADTGEEIDSPGARAHRVGNVHLSPGNYEVSVAVTNDLGATDRRTGSVSVSGDPITAFELHGTGNVELYYQLYRPYADQDPAREAGTLFRAVQSQTRPIRIYGVVPRPYP